MPDIAVTCRVGAATPFSKAVSPTTTLSQETGFKKHPMSLLEQSVIVSRPESCRTSQCDLKKVAQLGVCLRIGDGSMPCALRMLTTEILPIRNPTFLSWL